KQINKYLMSNLAAEQQKQIVESTIYWAYIILLNDIEFNNQDVECNNNFIENIYDTSWSYLSSLISKSEYSTIQEKLECEEETQERELRIFKNHHNKGKVLIVQDSNKQLISVKNVLDPAYHVGKEALRKKCIKDAQENNQTKKNQNQ
ncbi:912_t:CDS:2, partial [Racocetra persica]